jgi:uncharacterized membrane protein
MIGFGFGGMFPLWGALLALLIGGAALVFRPVMGAGAPIQNAGATARRILDERLARVEIDREEYDSVVDRIER